MKPLKPITVATLIAALLTGCSLNNRRVCDKWKSSGEIYSTMDSCLSCVDSLGAENVDAVRGCALGLDAAKLVSSR